MFDPQTLSVINAVAYELSLQGRPERDALALVTDPRKNKELQAVLKSHRDRGGFQCVGCQQEAA